MAFKITKRELASYVASQVRVAPTGRRGRRGTPAPGAEASQARGYRAVMNLADAYLANGGTVRDLYGWCRRRAFRSGAWDAGNWHWRGQSAGRAQHHGPARRFQLGATRAAWLQGPPGEACPGSPAPIRAYGDVEVR